MLTTGNTNQEMRSICGPVGIRSVSPIYNEQDLCTKRRNKKDVPIKDLTEAKRPQSAAA